MKWFGTPQFLKNEESVDNESIQIEYKQMGFALMTSQISGPCCCDSDIELDQYKSFVWESHVRQQIFIVFEDFYHGYKKQNPA